MKKINFRWLFYPFIAFLLGANMSRKVFAGNLEMILICCALMLGVGLLCVFKKQLKRLLVLSLALLVGFGWYFVGLSSFNIKEYSSPVAVVGRVTDSVADNGYTYTVVLDDAKIDGENAGKIQVQLSKSEGFEVGNFVAFETTLTRANPFTLDRFNSSAYRNGIRYYAKATEFAVVDEGYITFDERVRLAVKEVLHQNMSNENAETAYASLFGDKSNLDDDIYSAYQAAGIIHILTVSGLHVGFLITLVYGFLKLCRVNKYVNFALTTLFIIFYAYLCNFSPSVLRAGVMGIILMTSKLCYRKYDGLNSVGLAGFILCLARPLNAVDIGFLMSVFCVTSIFVLMPLLTKWFSKIMPKKFADVFAVSISAQVGILPMLCMMGGTVNLLSIFANLIIVPLFGLAYPLLFVLAFAGTILPFVSKCLVVMEYLFAFMLLIAKFFATGPIINLKRLDFAKILLFYAILFVVSQYFMVLPKERLIVFAAMILAYAVVFGCYYFKGTNLSTISYISQYSESSVVLKNSKGEVAVVGNCNLIDDFSNCINEEFDIFIANQNVLLKEYKLLQECGISSFISYKQSSFTENEVFSLNQDYIVGGFKVTYLSAGTKVAGVRVNFDNLEIFIATGEKLSYNEFEELNGNYNFDFVFANYALKEADFVHISTNKVEGCDYCFDSVGNMAFEGTTLRRLD